MNGITIWTVLSNSAQEENMCHNMSTSSVYPYIIHVFRSSATCWLNKYHSTWVKFNTSATGWLNKSLSRSRD